MAVGTTTYGDISPRTAAKAMFPLLERGMPYLVIEKFGKAKPLPSNSSKTATFRRYTRFSTTPKTVTEGVTPSATMMESADVSCTLVQYGDRTVVSDVVRDTHEDPVLMEANEILGEQAPIMIETVRYNVIKAGTSVEYANGTVRTAVNTPLTLNLQRKIIQNLDDGYARAISRVVRSTPDFGTANVAPSFIGICHTNLEPDIRDLPGFVPVEEYGSLSPYESEIGKCERVRYVASQVITPWANAGGVFNGSGTSMMRTATTSTAADVYPILYVGQDAYGIVALKGKFAITLMVVNAKPSDSDPMAQRSHVSWKTMQTAIILNDAWMYRAEVAATLL